MERGLSSTSAPNQGSISRRFLSTAIIICLFISFFPSVAADDDWSTANVLTDGSSSSDSVDADGDVQDWWTIDIVTGDKLEIFVSSPTGDYGFDLFGCFCFFFCLNVWNFLKCCKFWKVWNPTPCVRGHPAPDSAAPRGARVLLARPAGRAKAVL